MAGDGIHDSRLAAWRICSPKGENDPNVPGGFASANPWKRLVVLFAGPLMNLLTAIVVFSFLISFEGVPCQAQ